MPWSDIQRPSQVDIFEVKPGSVNVFRGQTVEIATRVGGLEEDQLPFIEYSTLDGQFVNQRIAMRSDGVAGHFAGTLGTGETGIQQDLEYRVIAGDAISRTYEVHATEAPHIIVDHIEFDYPAYTNLADETVSGEGDIRAIEGTKVTIHGKANQPIRSGHVAFLPAESTEASVAGKPQAPKLASMTAKGDVAQVRFTLRMDAKRKHSIYRGYRMHFRNSDDVASVDAIEHSIEATPDLKPTVQILTPDKRTLELPENGWQKIEVRAVDPDYQLTKVQLAARTRGRPLFKESLYQAKLATEGHSGQFVGTFTFVPRDFGLKDGDVVEYLAVAEDNRHASLQNRLEANRTITARQYIRIVAADPLADDVPPPEQRDPDAPKQDPPGQQEPDQQPPQQGEQGGEQGGEQNEGDPAEQQPGGEGEQGAEGEQGKEQQGGQQGEGQEGQGQQQQGEGDQSGTQQQSGNDTGRGEQQSDSNSGQIGESQGDNLDADGPAGDQSTPQDPNRDPGQGGQQDPSGNGESGGDPNTGDQQTGDQQTGDQQTGDQQTGDQQTGDQQTGDQQTGGDGSQDQNGEQAGEQGANDEPLPSSGERDGEVVERIKQHMQEKGELEENTGQQAESQGEGQPDNSNSPSGGDSPEPSDSESQQNPEGKKTGDGQSQQGPQPQDGSQNQGASDQAQDGNPSDQPGAPGNEGDRHTDAANSADEAGPSPPDGKAKPEEQKGSDPSQSGSNGDPESGQPESSGSQGPNSENDIGEQGQPDESRGRGEKGKGDLGDKGAQGQGEEGSGEQSGDSDQTGKPSNGQPEKRGDSEGQPSGQEDSSDQTGEQSNGQPEKGEGNDGQSSGQDGKAADQPGKQSDGQSGKSAGDSQSSEQGGEAADSNQSGKASGNKSGKSSQSSDHGDSSGSDSGNVQGEGQASQDGELTGDDANLDYAREATDLVLEYLRDQKGKPDQELLDKLGWKPEDVQKFLRRWDDMKRKAGPKNAPTVDGQRELDEVLRGMGLQNPNSKVRKAGNQNDLQRNNRNTGRRTKVPPQLLDPFRAFQRALQQKK